MAKKKKRTKVKSKPARRKSKRTIGRPDTAVLGNYSPTDEVNSHPEWVKNNFPDYVSPHPHETAAVREFFHGGHAVKIITTYRVEVDGRPVRTHLSVDEDGQVFTHATPFVTYSSAIGLMKAVIDAYPESFSATSDHGGHEHGGHA